MGLREGDEIQLPCQDCASISLHFVIALGDFSLRCPKCQATNRFHIVRSGPELSILKEGCEETFVGED